MKSDIKETRILIYEDNERLRSSLVTLLETRESFVIVGDFGQCTQVEDHLEKLKPDVVLMDIDLPEMNGIEGVQKIRAATSDIYVIMLTVFDDSKNVYKALHAGANGYLSKKHVSDRLILSICDVMEGGAPMSAAIARMIMEDAISRGPTKTTADYDLSPREVEVLICLGKGNSYKMVADDLFISLDTVRHHIRGIYQKLHVQSQTEAISKALREGLID